MDDFGRFLEAGTNPEDWLFDNQRSIHSNSASSTFPPALDFAPPEFSQSQEDIMQSIEHSDTAMPSPSPNMSAAKREESDTSRLNELASPQLGSMLAMVNPSPSSSPSPESQIDPLHQRSLQPSQPELFRSIFGNSHNSTNTGSGASPSHASSSTNANHNRNPTEVSPTRSDEELSQQQAALTITNKDDGIMEIDRAAVPLETQRLMDRPRRPMVVDDNYDDDAMFDKNEHNINHASPRLPANPSGLALPSPRLPANPSGLSFPSPNLSRPINKAHDAAAMQQMLAQQQAILNCLSRTKENPGSSHQGLGGAAVRQVQPQHHQPRDPHAQFHHEQHNADPLSISGPTARKRRAENHPELDKDRELMEALMQDGEDHSWMEEDVTGVDEEYANLKAVYDALLVKQKSGWIASDETMELYRLQKRLELMGRLKAANTAASNGINGIGGEQNVEEEEGLFVLESRENVINRHARRERARQKRNLKRFAGDDAMTGGFGDDDEGPGDDGNMSDGAFAKMLEQELGGPGLDVEGQEEEQPRLTKSGKPRKKPGRRAKTAREVMERDMEREREKERVKAQKKKAREARQPAAPKKPGTKGKGKGKEKAGKGGKKGKGKGKQKTVTDGPSLLRTGNFRRWDGQDDVGQMILEDLMNNDPIAERLQNPIFNVGPEPENIIGKQVKTTQFQKLFANIPEGSSKSNAKSDKARLQQASKSFGFANVKAQDGKWLVKGMRSTLYHHQLLGAQWMVQRELSSEPPHGGLLADSMGLGKTVQTIACMVANPPLPADINRRVKATLIVVPATVIDQWIDEIRFHAHEKTFPKVLHYKASSHIPATILEDLDVVVTSYHEVMKQFPFPDRKERERIVHIGYQRWWKEALEGLGVLHQVSWYRVVLDEAHAIKNNSARTSLACQNLKSVYRWCLTGTPLLNRLEELFPYLRFLKANYSMDWQTFQKYFCDSRADDCHRRISTLLSYTMMRRTMKTSILNRPIITLPKPHPEIKYVQFSDEEKIIYRITENRFRSNLNTFFAKGEAARNYGVFMVQLLRLRQCTSHPFMLERTIKEAWTLEDVEELRARLSRLAHAEKLQPFYEQTKVWVEQSEAEREAAKAMGEDVKAGELIPFGRSDYGHSFNIDKALGTLSEQEMFDRVVCGLCQDVPLVPVKTDCGHIFCEECLTAHIHKQVAQGDEYQTCPSCDRLFQSADPVKHLSNLYDEEDSSSPNPNQPNSSKRQRNGSRGFSKGRDELGHEPATKDSTWVAKSDRDPDFPLAPSAKTAALKAILLKGFEEAPLDKVVIYVQFRTLARIVARICEGEGWGFLYLTGDTSLEHRNKVIKRFRDNGDTKILIAGLKCGGLGLNFPWANRCISLDLWWNHAVEQQAFGRIFRIGQLKETHMTRIVVKNSVDMRLLTMQLYKLENCEKAIREDGKKSERLGLRELANLFGFLKTDEDDNIVSVEADYDDDEEWNRGAGGNMGGNGGGGARGDVGAGGVEEMDESG